MRKARIGAALALLMLAAAGAVAFTAGSGGGETAAGAGGGGASASVERRTLAERLTASGRIGYAGESTVLARLSGTVTRLPAVGDVIRRGGPLYEVEGEPVVLMYGEVPAYRDLAEGASEGEVVTQLEENLVALGYEPGTVDEEFTSTTAAAVSAWQEDVGLEATGAVELGRVSFLPGPRRVTNVEATLGESIGSGGEAGALAGASEGEGAMVPAAFEGPAVEDGVESPGDGPERAPEGESPGDGPKAKPESEAPEGGGAEDEPKSKTRAPSTPTPEAGEAPATTAPEGQGEGAGSEAGSVPILETTSTRRVVIVELEPDQQSVARRGQRVEVVLPDGGEATGEVRRLEMVEESSEQDAPDGEETEAAVEVTVALTGKKRIPALDGATVSVVFTQGVRKDVLAVPLTALLAIGGDRFAVLVEEGSERRRIEVTPGLAADGYVEVEGDGLREGMRIEVAE